MLRVEEKCPRFPKALLLRRKPKVYSVLRSFMGSILGKYFGPGVNFRVERSFSNCGQPLPFARAKSEFSFGWGRSSRRRPRASKRCRAGGRTRTFRRCRAASGGRARRSSPGPAAPFAFPGFRRRSPGTSFPAERSSFAFWTGRSGVSAGATRGKGVFVTVLWSRSALPILCEGSVSLFERTILPKEEYPRKSGASSLRALTNFFFAFRGFASDIGISVFRTGI